MLRLKRALALGGDKICRKIEIVLHNWKKTLKSFRGKSGSWGGKLKRGRTGGQSDGLSCVTGSFFRSLQNSLGLQRIMWYFFITFLWSLVYWLYLKTRKLFKILISKIYQMCDFNLLKKQKSQINGNRIIWIV